MCVGLEVAPGFLAGGHWGGRGLSGGNCMRILYSEGGQPQKQGAEAPLAPPLVGLL